MDVKIYGAYKIKERGVWRARIVADNLSAYVYGSTKMECLDKAIQKQKEFRSHVICNGTTVEEFSSIWLRDRCESLSPTSYAEWKRLLDKWIVPQLGKYKIEDLRCAHCQTLISKYNANHSAKSCKALRGVLHTMLEYAKQNELIMNNPCEHIRIAPTPAPQYYIYSSAEMKRLLQAVKGEPVFEIPITLASKCGLRAGEIFGLRWDDIDFEKRTLQVRQVSIYANGKKSLKNVPKTAYSSKPIVIPTNVIDLLKTAKMTAKFPLVVCDDDGTPIVSNNYSKRFAELLVRLHMPKTRFHDLRHFVATSLMDAGLPDKVIAEYMRHSDTNMTKHYQHIRNQTKSKASDTIESILS